MEYSHKKTIRLYELKRVMQIIEEFYPTQKNIKILEIGAGAGWQAKILSEKGYEVDAIELEDSNYNRMREFPITDYNGKDIPSPDNTYDIVFSSNVLEHIPHLPDFHPEMKRVLKPDGLAIHLMPSGTWVFWRIVVHYPAIVKMALDLILQKIKSNQDEKEDSAYAYVHDKYEKLSLSKKLRKALFPSRHGERGNAISEIYYFSKLEWTKIFKAGKWNIIRYEPNRLIYTGHVIFGKVLSIPARRMISRILGSSCHIFLLKK